MLEDGQDLWRVGMGGGWRWEEGGDGRRVGMGGGWGWEGDHDGEEAMWVSCCMWGKIKKISQHFFFPTPGEGDSDYLCAVLSSIVI